MATDLRTRDSHDRLRIGAGFLGHVAPHLSVKDYVRAAARAEEAGMDSFWVADQRWARDPWVTLTAIGENTEKIQIGTRITDPYIRHPATTAVAAATLADHIGGRFTLGLGAGGSGFSQIGLERDRPATAIREAIQIIRRLWAGDGTPFRGDVLAWGGGTLGFEVRSSIPIVVASRGPKILKMSGGVADGTIIASGAHTDAIAWALDQIRAGAEQQGKDTDDLEVMHQTYVTVDDDNPQLAVQSAKKAIVGAVVGSFPSFDFLGATGLRVPDSLSAYLAGGGKDSQTVESLIPDVFATRLCAAGPSEDVADKIRQVHESGVQHVLVAFVPSGDETNLEQLTKFTDSVLPKLT